MTWTTLTLQVTTPLFNGGADPDGSAGFRPNDEVGIRVASIRGAMRFWFRALAACATGLDLDLLARLERRVFGGMGSRGEADAQATASPLVMRVPPGQASLSYERVPAFLQGREARWIGYLLGLGLSENDKGRLRLLRPFVPAERTFDLKLRFQHDASGSDELGHAVEALALASLWLTCTYGGVGARTRRGFGGLSIVAVDGDLPRPWTPRLLQAPGLDYYQRAEWVWPAVLVKIFKEHLSTLFQAEHREIGKLDNWVNPPPFPVLSSKFAPAVLAPRKFTTWEESVAYVGRELRLFRGNRPDDIFKRRQGRVRTAEWADVVKGDSAEFSLGALGLPVGYHEVVEDGRGKAEERQFMVNAGNPHASPPENMRRASPLWVRPVGAARSWHMFTFAFQAEFLPGPDAPGVHLWPDDEGNNGRELAVGQGGVKHLTDQWMDTIGQGKSFVDVIRY